MQELVVLEKIKAIILEKNDWMEIQDIANILGVDRYQQLSDAGHNSTIAQLINRYLKKLGFITKRIELEEGVHRIFVHAPSHDIKLSSNHHSTHRADTVSSQKIRAKSVDGKQNIGFPSRVVHHQDGSVLPDRLKNLPSTNTDALEHSAELKQVIKLISERKNIFITGYAGTGKSYLLTQLKKQFSVEVTSTTGLAAVNIQGQTIHSWAGVGICNKPIQYVVENILKRSKLKKQIINCRLLAIDEISMLDAKTLDYINSVLKIIRSNDKPFGGIQLLLFGDFFQLPPVEKEQHGFCFTSECWKALELHTIFLEKIYRQQDKYFIQALNNMRLNQLTSEDLTLFYSREVKHDTKNLDILHIFSTNQEADYYNQFKFNAVNNPVHCFAAEDKVHKKTKPEYDLKTLETLDKYCTAPKKLLLKKDCKVMLLTNLNISKGLINGSCGTVIHIEQDSIRIKFDNGISESIEKHTFEYYKSGDLVATREQYPLRLAYGITIHKSQGMTLEKLVVDCSRIFECGQAYVALSRIKSLEGLYLKSFHPRKIMVDPMIIKFYASLGQNTTLFPVKVPTRSDSCPF